MMQYNSLLCQKLMQKLIQTMAQLLVRSGAHYGIECALMMRWGKRILMRWVAQSNLRSSHHHPQIAAIAALGVALVITGIFPANALDMVNFGGVEFRYEKNAGSVQTAGTYPDAKVLLNGEIILQDNTSESIWIVGAFPTWQNPTLVVLNFSSGGNACEGSYAILDVKAARLTEKFGNCAQPVVREGSDSLVFAFADKPSELGWVFQNGQLTKVPSLREEQHVEIGVSAYKSKNYLKALEHLLARA
jgi:hypothetical protein